MANSITSLKRAFLSAFPVIGPHHCIEAELMLAGKKKITWFPVAHDDVVFEDYEFQKLHDDRKILDIAVAEGKLISVDVNKYDSNYPEPISIMRHYTQLGQEENLKMISEFNKHAFGFADSSEAKVKLDKDMGYYLSYRKRDILFFNFVENGLVPSFITKAILNLNSSCQAALREKLLLEAGYDLQKWSDNFGKAKCTR